MLLCKACNTRFEDGRSACPSCGRRVFASVIDSSRPEPVEQRPLSDANAAVSRAHETEVDLELGEVDVLEEAALTEVADEEVEKPEAPASRGVLGAEPGPTVFHLSAAQVRTLVSEQPGLLGAGLEIYRDKKKQPVGVDYRTPVGAIDLLARDVAGDYVVVAVPDPRDADMLMPEVLARIGWVRKHLAGDRHKVRGIVVIEEIPEELAYAAAGVAQTVIFKTYRVALTFHDLSL